MKNLERLEAVEQQLFMVQNLCIALGALLDEQPGIAISMADIQTRSHNIGEARQATPNISEGLQRSRLAEFMDLSTTKIIEPGG